jgi:DNA-binding MarR family transcriptional regulator
MRVGKTQLEVLKCLGEHPKGWSQYCGWTWGTISETKAILKALVKKGLVQAQRVNPPGSLLGIRDVYTLSDAGIKFLEERYAKHE